MGGIDIKGIVAVLVVVGSFGLIGVYVYHGQVPDATVAGIVGTSLGLVLGFYFGHLNGSVQTAIGQANALSQQATQILTLAQHRRASDPPPPVAPLDVKVANP